jgi:hypothetical protein
MTSNYYSDKLIDLEKHFRSTNHHVDGLIFIVTSGKPTHETYEERRDALQRLFEIDVKGNGERQSFKQQWRGDFGYGIYVPIWSYFHKRVLMIDKVIEDEQVDAVVLELSVITRGSDGDSYGDCDDYDKWCSDPDSTDRVVSYFSQLVPMRHFEYQSYDYDHEELVREEYYSKFSVFSRDVQNGKVFIAPTFRRSKDVLLLKQCFLSNCYSPLTFHVQLERNGYWLDVEKEKHILECL